MEEAMLYSKVYLAVYNKLLQHLGKDSKACKEDIRLDLYRLALDNNWQIPSSAIDNFIDREFDRIVEEQNA